MPLQGIPSIIGAGKWRLGSVSSGGGGIVIDQLNAGETAVDTASSTIVMATSSAVASNGFIVLTACWFVAAGQTLSGVAGGGLTWAIDKQANDSELGVAIISAQAPSGLASSTNLTATLSASVIGARSLCGTSFTGVATSSPVDTTSGPTASVNAAWSSASTAIAAGSLLIACSPEFTNAFTSTPTAPSIEAHDVSNGGFACTTAYRIESGAGSYTVAGTWSDASAGGTTIAVAYKKA